MKKQLLLENKKIMSYSGLVLVVLIWGITPIVTKLLYRYYSPTFKVFCSEIIMITCYIIISRKKLNLLNKQYFKIALPTGLFAALANISQKIGLLYTTPGKYAFLENLSIITVPIVVFILTKRKPSVMTLISSILCLIGVFILNGMTFNNFTSTFGIGEILCALSGLFYGVNIAGTGIYAKNFFVPLYLAIQSFVDLILALICSIIFNNYRIINNQGIMLPIEKITFSFNPLHIIFMVTTAVITGAMCWILRTNCMKHVDTNVVSIIMPFSSVITIMLSVIIGEDILTWNLVIGAIICFFSIILSSILDIKNKN